MRRRRRRCCCWLLPLPIALRLSARARTKQRNWVKSAAALIAALTAQHRALQVSQEREKESRHTFVAFFGLVAGHCVGRKWW
jgi:hypothetical protein